MALKELVVDGVGPVTFQKRRGTRSVRIHIQGHNVRVTLPNWVSYQDAVKFVISRQEWISDNRAQRQVIVDGNLIGKRFQVEIVHTDIPKPKTRLKKQIISIQLPKNMSVEDTEAQKAIERACERALTVEAKELLAPRLHDLAYEHGFDVSSLHYKKLKRRWGSCDSNNHIILNIFLTQLPWEYIDYVILHELTHTRHLNHGKEFWDTLSGLLPNAKVIRKQMHGHHPQLMPR